MNEKESGVIMHITSLPSKYGIGGLGKEAYKFIDYIKECGFSYWEILPLEDVGFSNSPFQVITAFGLNPLLIDIDDLIEQGLVNSRDLQNLDFGENPRKVDFQKVTLSKDIVFKKAFKRFDLEKNLITTSDKITITGPNFVNYGTGLKADLTEKKIYLGDPHARYEPD